MEARGTGVNTYVYFALNSPLDAWTQLPDLKPQDVKNARSIRYQLSGDLDSKIYTNPFYFEKENVFLRAQIARVSCSTTLTAKSLFKLDAENAREIVKNEAEGDDAPIPKPTSTQMKSLDMWVHSEKTLL